MNFSLKTEYALRALYFIGQETKANEKPLGREQIAKTQKIPIHFLENILIDLKKYGLVKSVRGPGGGYLLAKPSEEINLWDIYAAVDYKDYDGIKCFPGLTKECDQLDVCKVKSVWFEFNQDIKTNMKKYKLSEIN